MAEGTPDEIASNARVLGEYLGVEAEEIPTPEVSS